MRPTSAPLVAWQAEEGHLLVGVVGELGALGRGVAQVGLGRAVDAGVEDVGLGDADGAGGEVVVGAHDGLVDAVDDGVEALAVVAEDGEVVEGVVRVATGAAMGVGGAQHDVVVAVGGAVGGAQPLDDLLLDALEDLAEVGAHEGDALAVARRGDDEGAGAQAGVDAGGLLVEHGVAHHADLGGGAGDVVDARSDGEALVAGAGTEGVGLAAGDGGGLGGVGGGRAAGEERQGEQGQGIERSSEWSQRGRFHGGYLQAPRDGTAGGGRPPGGATLIQVRAGFIPGMGLKKPIFYSAAFAFIGSS